MVIQIIICLVASYLIGSVSTAVLLTRRLPLGDVRNHGSHNAGATNVVRVYGWKWGGLTYFLDMVKGFVPVLLAGLWIGDAGTLTATVGVIVGHDWPIFFGFKGGKGVASSIGAMFAFMPVEMAIILAVGILLIVFTKMVSLGAMTGALLALIVGIAHFADRPCLMAANIFLAVVLIIRHRENISRILHKNENKIVK